MTLQMQITLTLFWKVHLLTNRPHLAVSKREAFRVILAIPVVVIVWAPTLLGILVVVLGFQVIMLI